MKILHAVVLDFNAARRAGSRRVNSDLGGEGPSELRLGGPDVGIGVDSRFFGSWRGRVNKALDALLGLSDGPLVLCDFMRETTLHHRIVDREKSPGVTKG